MSDEIWHMDNSLFEKHPDVIFKSLLDDDKANYKKAEADLAEPLALLDKAMILYIEALKGAYMQSEHWKENLNTRMAMSMGYSALNYMLLARHVVLLGYFPEARDLLRGCHERITRSYLFLADDEACLKFYSDEEIHQKEVDLRLAGILGGDTEKDDIQRRLRVSYISSSQVVHPNIESLKLRTIIPENKNYKDYVGLHSVVGGIMAPEYGKIVILATLSTVRFALKIISAISADTSGIWQMEFEEIENQADAILEEIRQQHENEQT